MRRPESASASDRRYISDSGSDGVAIAGDATAVQLVPGSSWGTFTIACTIPIALFVGLYMYKLRKGRVLEASLIGAVGVLAATVAGNWIPGSPLEAWFSLTQGQTILALTRYGFIASVLPVWLLLCPRDYLSSFLKIGTIALLVVGVLVANPASALPAGQPRVRLRRADLSRAASFRSSSSASCAGPSPASMPWSRPAPRRR